MTRMMNPLMRLAFGLILLLSVLGRVVIPATNAGEPSPADPPLRLLIVTGGHDFERDAFFAMFEAMDGVTYREVQHPAAHAFLTSEAAKDYDVLVFYDMWQDISAEAKENFLALLSEGIPVVALHHCLAGYQHWDAYREIIGGKYHLEPTRRNGLEIPASTFHHDVEFEVKIVDPEHPVTHGMKDFMIHDETYGSFEVLPEVTPLLRTDAPTSTRIIGWTHRFRNSPVVYIELGHDHLAYENPNYRRLLRQAIHWVAGR